MTAEARNHITIHLPHSQECLSSARGRAHQGQQQGSPHSSSPHGSPKALLHAVLGHSRRAGTALDDFCSDDSGDEQQQQQQPSWTIMSPRQVPARPGRLHRLPAELQQHHHQRSGPRISVPQASSGSCSAASSPRCPHKSALAIIPPGRASMSALEFIDAVEEPQQGITSATSTALATPFAEQSAAAAGATSASAGSKALLVSSSSRASRPGVARTSCTQLQAVPEGDGSRQDEPPRSPSRLGHAASRREPHAAFLSGVPPAALRSVLRSPSPSLTQQQQQHPGQFASSLMSRAASRRVARVAEDSSEVQPEPAAAAADPRSPAAVSAAVAQIATDELLAEATAQAGARARAAAAVAAASRRQSLPSGPSVPGAAQASSAAAFMLAAVFGDTGDLPRFRCVCCCQHCLVLLGVQCVLS